MLPAAPLVETVEWVARSRGLPVSNFLPPDLKRAYYRARRAGRVRLSTADRILCWIGVPLAYVYP